MAQFNIDAHLSNGQRLEWLALPASGESADEVECQVRKAAVEKFGAAAFFNRWDRQVASNGYITVRMYA
ncbi:hypothetical protein D3C76_538240 [compost metagenome]